jgi:mycothiol synthase
MNAQQPQLHMKRRLDVLPALAVPDGYTVRHFMPDDAERWAALLHRNTELGAWNTERALPYFAAGSDMPLEGAFFAMHGSTPVATAQLHRKPDRPSLPELGWVAVDPQHQGHGLAAGVSVAVMQYAASAGYQEVFLLTDDHRLAAIWTYLKLGFEPWLTDASHAARWAAVQATLDRHRASTSVRAGNG